MSQKRNTSTTSIAIEKILWEAANKLRKNIDAAEYKHVVLGLIFLRYISEAFEDLHEKLEKDPHSDPEEKLNYDANSVFWVPLLARWHVLQAKAKSPEIGKIIGRS